MTGKFKTSSLNLSILLLTLLTVLAYGGNYFSYPFGFGVDFLFGSIAVLIIVNIYGFWWGTISSLIASSYTIILWQHPYALIIFAAEALFVGLRLRRPKQNLLTVDMTFWVLVGIPLVILFYGYMLKVGVVATEIIALKQAVNGIFNALVASLILNCKPIYLWAKSSPKKSTVLFEHILLNLLVAFVLIPALVLTIGNNEATKQHEQEKLIVTLDTAAQNLATDIRRWHQSGIKALNFMAETSSHNRIVVTGQTQHGLDLEIESLPLFKNAYIINADFETIAQASKSEFTDEQLNFSELELPRIPQIFVLPESTKTKKGEKPKILQTLPIILNDRWLGNIIAELNIDFIKQLLTTETHSVPLNTTLFDKNQLLIATTDNELDAQQKINRDRGIITDIKSNDSNKIYHWLSSSEEKPLVVRWRNSVYVKELFIDEKIPLFLRVEAPAAPYIDYLQILNIKSLAVLLAISLTAIFMAKYISRILVKPLLKLATFTNNLPHKILRNEKIILPRSSTMEMNALSTNFEEMSRNIEENIQQIKLTNRKLKQAKENLEIANQAKDQFLANVSHELKTPLNSILGYSRLIQKSLTADERLNIHLEEQSRSREWLDNVRQDGKYLLTLIDEILDIAQSQANQIELSSSLVEVSSFLEDLALVGRRKAAKKNITFKLEMKGQLPQNIYADEKRLKQIILNLLDNAIKFTQQGQIIFRVSAIETSKLKESNYSANGPFELTESEGIILPSRPQSSLPCQVQLRFEVIDTGIGIASQNLTKIFRPFERVNQQEFSELGTGLGLSISKKLVELMGGKLKVISEPERGSIFWFDLMLPKITISSAIDSKSFQEIIGHKGKRQTLLIVDDIKTSRLLLKDILKPLGFEILTAKNGQEGLQLAIENKPDLILTDLFMPIKTGFTLVAELRRREYFVKTPIIAISASSFEEIEKQSRASGCDAFLAKPISDRKLLNLLGRYLNLEWVYKTTSKI